jgi:hypothetical protein
MLTQQRATQLTTGLKITLNQIELAAVNDPSAISGHVGQAREMLAEMEEGLNSGPEPAATTAASSPEPEPGAAASTPA